MTIQPFTDVDALLGVLDDDRPDDGEPVTARDHALQCADILARERPHDVELQIAGLVHDVASSLIPRPPGDHAVLSAHLVRPLLGDRVADLAGGHVEAKRYLVASDPAYAALLSDTSTTTLVAQGGRMTDREIAAFTSSPLHADWVCLRRADDAAKVPGRAVPGLEHWRPILASLARRHAHGPAPAALDEAGFSVVLDSLLEGFQVIGHDWRYLYLNTAAAQHGRTTRDALVGRTMMECYPGIDQTPLFAEMKRCMEERVSHVMENVFTYPDGKVGHFELRIQPAPLGISILSMDVTAKREAEAALRKSEERLNHAQRMQAVGTLAAGLAHDFNNLLGVILGTAELANARLTGPVAADVNVMLAAAKRAAELTRQLLAYGRRQIVRRETVDVFALIEALVPMLRGALGGKAELVLRKDRGSTFVDVDPGQIEQAVVNLVLNARDAMPGGGRVDITVSEVELDESYVRDHADAVPGPHVMIAVADTGIGMDAATRARIFEPFFTTKEPGRGTGLGLASVYGSVKQNGGNVWVYSELGQGTTFKIYLPRAKVAEPAEKPAAKPAPKGTPIPHAERTVLVADDNEGMRKLMEATLVAAGYRVLLASSGVEALEKLAADEPIPVLVTDVVMPGLSGPELIERVRKARPEVRIVCTSGYASDALRERGMLSSSVAFLEKPFRPSDLVKTVRALLDG